MTEKAGASAPAFLQIQRPEHRKEKQQWGILREKQGNICFLWGNNVGNGAEMKLLFKQRFFSWFDSYDIYGENGETIYTVKGQLAWGHCLKIFNAAGCELGTVKERVFSFLPRFEIWTDGQFCGCIVKEFSWFRPKFRVELNGWRVEGDFWQWNYSVTTADRELVATVSKELFHWTDTYVLDIVRPEDALGVLMLTLAIDAQKCSAGNG